MAKERPTELISVFESVASRRRQNIPVVDADGLRNFLAAEGVLVSLDEAQELLQRHDHDSDGRCELTA